MYYAQRCHISNSMSFSFFPDPNQQAMKNNVGLGVGLRLGFPLLLIVLIVAGRILWKHKNKRNTKPEHTFNPTEAELAVPKANNC